MSVHLKREKLADILAQIDSPYMIGLTTQVVPSMRLTNNPFKGRIQKVSRVRGVLGFRYEAAVQRRRIKQSDPEIPTCEVPVFVPAPRQWGSKDIPIRPLVTLEKDGQIRNYLELCVNHVDETHYLCDGKIITDKQQLEDLMKFIKRKTNEGARQQLKKPLILRDYRTDHIISLRTSGEEFILED